MIVAVDLGTSGVRVSAVGSGDEVLALHRTRIKLHSPGPGREQCMLGDVEAAVFGGIRSVVAEADQPVEALSFSSQGEVVFALDPADRPPHTFTVTMDGSGIPAVSEWLADGRTADQFAAVTGQPLHAMFPIFRFRATSGTADRQNSGGVICSLDSYLRRRLGGSASMDYSLAARSGFFDVNTKEWSEDHCQWAGVSTQQFAPVLAPGTLAGSVDAEGSQLSGLPEGTPLVVGSHDQACAFWGAGGAPGERAVFSAGSSECLTQATIGRPGDAGVPLPSYPVDDTHWLTLIGSPAGGWAMEWLADFTGRSIEELIEEAARIPSTSTVVHPYFAGGSTFRNDPTMTASVRGLTLNSRPAEFALALIEASGFETFDALTHTRHTMGSPSVIVSTGSGSTLVTTQIRADAVGLDFLLVDKDAATRGAVLQARVALGEASRLVPSDPPPGVRVEPREWDHIAVKREEYLNDTTA